MVLARLLAPSDFGLVAIVTTFSYLLINFGLNGITEAIVQSDALSHQMASTLFWLNVGCSGLLTLGFSAAGGSLAWFFKDPLVRPVAIGISATIFVTGLSVIHLALLKRAMRFADLSFNDIRAKAVSVLVSIALGWAGWGYWALVAGLIALALSTTIGAWWMCRWLPGRPRRVEGLARMVRFAVHTYGSFSISYASHNADNLLVGWRFSVQSLGYYKKAYDLFALSATQLVSSISVVVVGALSRLRRDEEQYRRHLLAAMSMMAFVGMGLGADLTLIGKDLIRLLMGARWAQAGTIFTFFGPGIGIMIVYYMNGWIHLSIGHPDRWLRWSFVEFLVTVSLFLIALPHGPSGIALAWTVSFWILAIPGLWYAGRPIGLGIAPMLGVIWRYLAASLLAAASTAIIVVRMTTLNAVTGSFGAFLRVAVTTGLVAVFYLIAVIALHGGFAPMQRILLLLKDMIGTVAVVDPAQVGRVTSPRDSLLMNALGEEPGNAAG